MDLIAKLPSLAAAIYRRSFKKGALIAADPKLDWAGNYAHQMGFTDEQTKEARERTTMPHPTPSLPHFLKHGHVNN